MVEAHDPYVAPEMAKWQPVYRSGRDFLMPAGLLEIKQANDKDAWKEKLFLLDTGAEANLLSRAAATEGTLLHWQPTLPLVGRVEMNTRIVRDDSMSVRGLDPNVGMVYAAGQFSLAFAGLRQDSPSFMPVYMTNISHDDGVEVSGLIGAPALSRVVLHIDYRDNLVRCEYKAKK